MEIIGSCGLVCSECPAYIAHYSGDDTLRAKTAKEWSKMYGAEIKAGDIDCTGCRLEGVKISHCSECAVRLCAIDKNVKNCAECNEYICSTLEEFLGFAPEAKKKLTELRDRI